MTVSGCDCSPPREPEGRCFQSHAWFRPGPEEVVGLGAHVLQLRRQVVVKCADVHAADAGVAGIVTGSLADRVDVETLEAGAAVPAEDLVVATGGSAPCETASG